MEKVLIQYYNILEPSSIRKYNDLFIVNEEYLYLIMIEDDNELFYEEQNLLAKYCINHGYEQFMRIIPNIYGEMITTYKEQKLRVWKARLNKDLTNSFSGKGLADFHQVGYFYPYEPKHESSYGKWKQLWIENLTFFEKEIVKKESVLPASFLLKIRNLLPYLIGISENAIQYLAENEGDLGFTNFDRPTICFKRYRGQLGAGYISFGELIYDHPIRDITEAIREMLLYHEQGIEISFSFLMDYHNHSEISLYAFKLLYARLLYPTHFFDLLYQQLLNEKSYTDELVKLKEIQVHYQTRVREFFQLIERNFKPLPMHMLKWL